jgi:hypothetical protein
MSAEIATRRIYENRSAGPGKGPRVGSTSLRWGNGSRSKNKLRDEVTQRSLTA